MGQTEEQQQQKSQEERASVERKQTIRRKAVPTALEENHEQPGEEKPRQKVIESQIDGEPSNGGSGERSQSETQQQLVSDSEPFPPPPAPVEGHSLEFEGVMFEIEGITSQVKSHSVQVEQSPVRLEAQPVEIEGIPSQLDSPEIPWQFNPKIDGPPLQDDGMVSDILKAPIEMPRDSMQIEEIPDEPAHVQMNLDPNRIRTKEDWLKELEERLKAEDRTDSTNARLKASEQFWASLQPWFESHGYMLRPRYRPGWVPSWLKEPGRKIDPFDCEDWIDSTNAKVMDATRISDNSVIILKTIWTQEHPNEIDIGQYLSSDALGSDSTNHCVPILDVLECPKYENLSFIVMPLLRWFDNPNMGTIGEAVDFFKQVFEGLQFMHKHHIVHRNCTAENIFMDATAMYSKGFHPQMNYVLSAHGLPFAPHFSRTERPPKYYFIDFGLSTRYNPEDGTPVARPVLGTDDSVPEFRGEGAESVPTNPFAVDVYYLGNVVKIHFISRYTNFAFLEPLIDAMTHTDPSSRPSMNEVVSSMEDLIQSLPKSKLRSSLIKRDSTKSEKRAKALGDVFRKVRWMVRGVPPMPMPSYGSRIMT